MAPDYHDARMPWLFPDEHPAHPMTGHAVREACQPAHRRSRIPTPITPMPCATRPRHQLTTSDRGDLWIAQHSKWRTSSPAMAMPIGSTRAILVGLFTIMSRQQASQFTLRPTPTVKAQ